MLWSEICCCLAGFYMYIERASHFLSIIIGLYQVVVYGGWIVESDRVRVLHNTGATSRRVPFNGRYSGNYSRRFPSRTYRGNSQSHGSGMDLVEAQVSVTRTKDSACRTRASDQLLRWESSGVIWRHSGGSAVTSFIPTWCRGVSFQVNRQNGPACQWATILRKYLKTIQFVNNSAWENTIVLCSTKCQMVHSLVYDVAYKKYNDVKKRH